jgi:hypothetical protein
MLRCKKLSYGESEERMGGGKSNQFGITRMGGACIGGELNVR